MMLFNLTDEEIEEIKGHFLANCSDDREKDIFYRLLIEHANARCAIAGLPLTATLTGSINAAQEWGFYRLIELQFNIRLLAEDCSFGPDVSEKIRRETLESFTAKLDLELEDFQKEVAERVAKGPRASARFT